MEDLLLENKVVLLHFHTSLPGEKAHGCIHKANSHLKEYSEILTTSFYDMNQKI